jgi:hypothetical protein
LQEKWKEREKGWEEVGEDFSSYRITLRKEGNGN